MRRIKDTWIVSKENVMIKCLMCGKEFMLFNILSRHISKDHNITKQQYYDLHLKKENEGICKECGNSTKFENINFGYHEFCCNKCSSKNKDVLDRKLITRREMKIDVKKEVICKICNKKLVSLKALSQHVLEHNVSSKEYYDKYIKLNNDENVCKGCKKETKFVSIAKGYQTFCSLKCSNSNEETKKMLSRKWTKEKLEKAKEKREETNLKRYGNVCVNRNDDIKEKTKESFLKNRLPKVLKYLKQIDIELVDVNEYNNYNSILTFKCKKCLNTFKSTLFNIGQRTYKCDCQYEPSTSVQEKEVLSFVEDLLPGYKIIKNSKSIIKPKELDIYIPAKKIAIEFNGLYYHSEQFCDKEYHVSKLEMCRKKNIKLIQIFNDEWMFKKEITKSRIKRILGLTKNFRKLNARDCEIVEIESNTKNSFLEENHTQGKDNSFVKLGAFYNNELVSVMTFSYGNISKGNKKVDKVFELNRFCTKLDCVVRGIASKMLAYFTRKYDYEKIFSYADRRWSDGDMYKKIGFTLEKITEPNYWYTKDGFKRIHRFNLRKTKNDPKEIPEYILRFKEGYQRVWDCGNYKFSLIK